MSERLFLYCERGLDPGFGAEPVNAASNAAFVLVAILIWRRVAHVADDLGPRARAILLAMCSLAALVGLGSFAFHTLATGWAQGLDVAPIGLFVLASLCLSVRWVFDGTTARSALAVSGLALLTGLAAWGMTQVGCHPRMDRPDRLLPCLNGSWTYVPTGLLLATFAALAHRQTACAAPWLVLATAAFASALVARSLDLTMCNPALRLTWHTAWHLAAAFAVYAILRALLVSAPRHHASRVARPKVRPDFFR